MKPAEIKKEYIRLRAEGKSNSFICDQLHISKSTCTKWKRTFVAEIDELKRKRAFAAEIDELKKAELTNLCENGMTKEARIKRLLNKKDWTGRELGILELTNTCVVFRQALEGKEPQPIVEHAQLRKMVNTIITDRQQGQIYNGYISIHEWLVIRYNIAQTHLQQAQLRYRELVGYVTNAILAEEIYSYIEQLPAIMTQTQYDDTKERSVEDRFKDNEGEELYSNVFNLVCRAIHFYLKQLQMEPNKANPLKAIRKKYVSQPVESEYIRSRWYELIGMYIESGAEHYKEAPVDFMKWDVIEQNLLPKLYPADIDGSGDENSESNFIASMKDFIVEFRELITAILKDIDKHYFKGKLRLSDLPIKKWLTTLYGWRELYEENFYGEREEAEADTSVFYGNKRALLNGIAILRASDFIGESPRIDKRGYYIEPDIHHTLSNFTLEAFFPEAEDYADNIDIAESARKTLIESYYHLKGYNLSLELIASFYDVPEMTVFQMNIEEIENKIRAFNEIVPILYKKITDTDYADEELKAKKLQVLNDFFQPIDYEAIAIPAKNAEQAEELLKDFTAFKPENADRFNTLLCVLPEGAAKSEDGERAY